jgi:hypothetical protein
VAAAVAARSGRPLLLTGGRSMALATRQWLVRSRARVRGLTLVGTAEEQPALADWTLNKALR